jgi:hypothetical protein
MVCIRTKKHPGGRLIATHKSNDAIGTPYADTGAKSVLMVAGIAASLSRARRVHASVTDFFQFSGREPLCSCLGTGHLGNRHTLHTVGGFNWASPAMQYWYALIGCVVFSLHIVYDTWLFSKRLGPDDYIQAAATIYLDIVNLFIMILQLMPRCD